MDFDFSDDQQQLRDAVRKWVDKRYGFERRRDIARAGGFSREAWDELAELGLMGLRIPERQGGLGLGSIEAMVVMEELGRGIVLEPLAQALLAGHVLASHADAALQADWLPGIASGRKLVALAYQERQARYRLGVCAAEATCQSTGWSLSGVKSIVPAGDKADAILVPARVRTAHREEGQSGREGSQEHESASASDRIALFLVECAAAGVSARGYGTQDGSRAAECTLRAAPARLVTLDGLTALEQAVDIGLAAVCAEAVGVMDKTLAVTAEYLNTRRQFGAPIASFQALRHRVADMKMQLELARSMSYYASLKLDAPANERRRALSRAKVQLGEAMRFVGQQAVQLHGGIGVTNEAIVSHYFKKLTQLELTFGDTMHHLGEVSAGMQDAAGVFA